MSRGRAFVVLLVAGLAAAGGLALVGAVDRPRLARTLAVPTGLALAAAYHALLTLVLGPRAEALARAEDAGSRWTLAALWAPFLVVLAIVVRHVLRARW